VGKWNHGIRQPSYSPFYPFYFHWRFYFTGISGCLLFFSDFIALGFSGLNHLISTALLQRIVCFLPLLILGVSLGHRGFIKSVPKTFRTFTLGLMICTVCWGWGE